MRGPNVRYYDWPYSPFCMKVRAILEHKDVAFESVAPLRARGLLNTRGTGKVPAIELDGEFVTDSTDIAYALDAHFPDPPLFPSHPRDRALCHAIEDWADESLYFIGLYYRWFEPEGRKPVAGVFRRSSPLMGIVAYRFYLRRILSQLKGQGTLRKSPVHVRHDMERHLSAVEGLLRPGPYVFGKAPYLCDFALWGQLAYLNRTPVGAEAIKGRRAIEQFLDRLGAVTSPR